MSKIYLMNSAVMPAGNYGAYTYHEAHFESLANLMNGEYGSYISCLGYQQNADLVEKWTGVRPPINRVEVRFEPGDEAFVMRLKRRVEDPTTKGAPVSEDPENWEFAWVEFHG